METKRIAVYVASMLDGAFGWCIIRLVEWRNILVFESDPVEVRKFVTSYIIATVVIVILRVLAALIIRRRSFAGYTDLEVKILFAMLIVMIVFVWFPLAFGGLFVALSHEPTVDPNYANNREGGNWHFSWEWVGYWRACDVLHQDRQA